MKTSLRNCIRWWSLWTGAVWVRSFAFSRNTGLNPDQETPRLPWLGPAAPTIGTNPIAAHTPAGPDGIGRAHRSGLSRAHDAEAGRAVRGIGFHRGEAGFRRQPLPRHFESLVGCGAVSGIVSRRPRRDQPGQRLNCHRCRQSQNPQHSFARRGDLRTPCRRHGQAPPEFRPLRLIAPEITPRLPGSVSRRSRMRGSRRRAC